MAEIIKVEVYYQGKKIGNFYPHNKDNRGYMMFFPGGQIRLEAAFTDESVILMNSGTKTTETTGQFRRRYDREEVGNYFRAPEKGLAALVR